MRIIARFECVTWQPVAVLVLSFVLSGELLARDKTDVIVMKNGDRITGEIKQLERGQLSIKPGYTNTSFVIDWEEVERIESDQLFAVDLRDGKRRSGVIRQVPPTEKPTENFDITTDREHFLAEPSEVIRIDQVERGFLRSLDGSIALGASVFTDNDQKQFNLNVEVKRLTPKHTVQLAASSYFTRQAEGVPTDRHNLNLLYLYTLPRAWYVGATAEFLQSDQQELQLRSTLGGLVARDLIRTNRNQLYAWAGIVLNRERYSANVGSERFNTNAESAFAVSYSRFDFDSTQLDAQVQIYPSLTQGGRYRIDFNTNFYLDLVGDLYLRFSFYNNFDSRPPADAPGSDRGLTTSLGWSF